MLDISGNRFSTLSITRDSKLDIFFPTTPHLYNARKAVVNGFAGSTKKSRKKIEYLLTRWDFYSNIHSMKRDFKSNIKSRGLTVADLATLLGVTPRQAWNYLTRRSIPRGESIIRLAGILGVTPEDILRGKKPSAKRAA